jgi:hypothetical protein
MAESAAASSALVMSDASWLLETLLCAMAAVVLLLASNTLLPNDPGHVSNR